ncbi:MAG TPA: hypothetical protein V6C81_21130 [Planktothrix sp.]|jgi:multisubunit Na+/H+ antiporter MnhB subunit
MDTFGLYGLITGAAIVIAVGLRFLVYTLLVRNSKWLPEKATRVANTASIVTVGVALVCMIGNALMVNHATH